LPREALERERVLREIEEERERLVRAREALERQAEAQASREHELDAEREQENALARLQSERELQELRRELTRARAEIQQAREQLKRKDLTRADVKSLEKSLNAAAGAGLDAALARQGRREPPREMMALDSEALLPGTRVVIRETGAIATVIDRPQRGEVALRVGALKLRTKLASLAKAPPLARHAETRKPKPQAARPDFTVARRTSDNTLDLRGVRVAEAEERIDAFLDRLFGQGESVGFVLHGHGTFALRDRVREHLGSSSYIEHARAAEADEGGAAFTVFWLR
jgi:DNA mismatch repair protein MutS2